MSDDKPMTVQEMAQLLGSRGGRKRANALPPERRTEIARKAGKARAKKAGQKLRRKRQKQ